MNGIKVFEHEKFGKVRTVLIDGEHWFVGKDVALCLAYRNPQKAIRDHVDDEDKTVNKSFTVNGTAVILINESGMYSLVLGSKKLKAKDFKRWITSDVLPSIRKFGIDTAILSDEIMVTVMGSFAQEESASISNNIRWSIRRKIKNGTVKFSSAPYGYDLKDGSIIMNNAEAEIIRKIFNMFLSGMGYLSICRELNESNIIKNDKRTKWVPAAIQYILTNEKYIGEELMTEFDEIIFESLVEKIIVKNQTELEFNLYGGLKFTEKI